MILIILTGASSGGFTILNYAATILSTSGVGLSPELQSLSIPIFMTIGSLFTFATVDKLGRKVSEQTKEIFGIIRNRQMLINLIIFPAYSIDGIPRIRSSFCLPSNNRLTSSARMGHTWLA